ncbi:MAG: VWA domain-containing protein [Bryobacterales bacterium]|nr:VWA domain-containing protein [Bryobacterales bacterium]
MHAAISQLQWKMRLGFPIEFPKELPEEFTPEGISEETETPPQSFGTMGALNYIVRGLKDIPGRKLIILFSDGLSLGRRDTLARELRQRFSDMAGRASAVVYTIYAAGVQAPPSDPAAYDPLRAPMLSDSAPAMRNLAAVSEQTGGRHFAYNDLPAEVSTILNQEAGYYLIGYRPDELTFRNPNRFHTLEVRVRRTGLTVRSRRGFYGVAEENLPAVPDDPKRQLANVLISPFISNPIAVRMEPRVSYSPKIGQYVSCTLYLDARPLPFSQDAEGWMNGAIEVLLATFGANGERVDVRAHTFHVRTRGRTYRHVLENGLTYIITLPVKKPGPYQVRVAVRDVKSGNVGSAFEFVQIPSASRNTVKPITNGLSPQ